MSFLQMVFLPSTFVAAIVSMNFFSFDSSPPKVSGYIWIFFVVALALTGITIGIYFWWKRHKKKTDEKEQEKNLQERKQLFEMREEAGSDPSDGSGDDVSGRTGRRKHRRRRKRSKPVDAEVSNLGGPAPREK